MSEEIAVEFTDPAGEQLLVEWAPEALAALDPGAAECGPAWRLGGELDWDEVEALRIVSGRLDDERRLAIAALRPAGVQGHGDELVDGMLGDAEGFERLAEALLSTEYGPDGLPSRIGLELYRDEDGLPVRIAGDAIATATSAQGGVRRLSAALALRSGGSGGTGVLDVLTRE